MLEFLYLSFSLNIKYVTTYFPFAFNISSTKETENCDKALWSPNLLNNFLNANKETNGKEKKKQWTHVGINETSLQANTIF